MDKKFMFVSRKQKMSINCVFLSVNPKIHTRKTGGNCSNKYTIFNLHGGMVFALYKYK